MYCPHPLPIITVLLPPTQTIDFLLYNDSASGAWDYLQNVGKSRNMTVTNTSLLRVRELINPNSSDSIWNILERTRDTANVSGLVLFRLPLLEVLMII